MRNKALTLLATLGIASSALANAPIQALTTATSQMHSLTTGQVQNEPLFAKMDELTALIQAVNQQAQQHLKAITKADLQQLETISVMLELSFDLLKRVYSEEDLRGVAYASARPFANAKNRLRQLTAMARQELGLIQREI